MTNTKFKIQNRILSLVLVLVMVLGMLPMTTIPTHAATESPCSGDHSGWTAITTTGQTTISKPGKYYLQKDMTGNVNYTTLKINCTGDVTICLNGKTINSYPPANTSTYRDAIDLQSGNLSLCDCVGSGKITRMYDYGSAGGVDISNGTTFNMYGGTITGLTYGAVSVNGVFNMYGGSISGNSNNYGGYIVHVYDGTFNMYGGSITNNTNIGVLQARYGSGTQAIYLEGNVKISGNSGGNLRIKSGKTVTVGELTDGAEIYVTSADTGSHIAITGTNTADYSKYFHADDSSYQILNKDNVIYLHKHSYSTANCVAPATCACGLTEGSKDSTNHNISTEWTTENGKHYKECLNGCGTKFEEGACSGGTATCTTPEICEACGVPYGEALGHDFVDGICSRCGISEDGVYHIYTAEQLVSFATLVNAGNKDADAVLMANIDMAGYEWTPICQTDSYHTSGSTVTDAGYAGTFDGNGHVISNLTVKGGSTATKSYGLFGTLSGTVKRLGLDNYSFNVGSADCRAGGIAGQVVSGGLITDCYVINSKVLTDSRIAGGIAGCNYGGTIRNCFVQNTEVTGYDDRFGWISGDCQDDGGNKPGTVINCYTDGTRVVSSQSGKAAVTDCAVVTDEQFASGEIAYKLNGSTSEGELAWKQTVGTHEHPVFEGGTVYKVFCENVELYSNENKNYETHDFVKGICSRCGELMPAVNNNGIYEIFNVGQFVWFAEFVNAGNTTANAKLMADIDITSCGNMMIGTAAAKYSGTFDGNGKTLTINFNSTEQYTAPFRYINGATIRNLTVDGTISTNQKFAAGLVGYSEGASRIEKCMVGVTINSSVSGDGTHGGLVANVSSGSMTIDNCGFIGSITGNGTHSCGGFVGWANGTTTISNSYVSGTFTTGTSNCYTFGRNAGKITVSNSYYKTAYGTNNSGATQKSADQFASGEVTYLLNGSRSDGELVWYQTIGTDDFPKFSGSVVYYDSANGYNNHIHNWTYTKDGNKITAICDATGCTNTDGGSVTLKISDTYYTGKTISATAEGNFTNGATYTITYNNGAITAPSTVGTHTATLTVSENGTDKQSITAEYEISYLPVPSSAYTISGYSHKDGNTYWFKDGATITITAPEGYTISKTLNSGYASSVTFSESESKVICLKNSNGEMTDAIQISETLSFDKTAPTGKIEIANRGFWEKLLNKIAFGLFFKGDKVATVTTADTDGSGIKSIEYYLADEDLIDNGDASALETAVGDQWQSYGNEIALNKNAKNVIYVKITDNVGNVTYINSEGIVLYTDAEAKTSEISYTYQENSDKDVEVTLGGNTVKSVACGDATLTVNTEYTVDGGTITLKADYLDTLNAGEYTYTVSYNPLGLAYVEATGNEAPATTTFKVQVVQADGSVTNISNISKTYDGDAVSEPTFDKLGTGKATIEYKVKDADDSTYTTTTPDAAGDYVVRVTVVADNNYKEASATAEFSIDKATFENVSVKQDGTLTYNKQAQTATVKTSATAVNNQTVTFTYSTDFAQDNSFTETVPSFTNAGEHLVYYKASAPNHEDYTGSFTVAIDKQNVNEPPIASKSYTGSVQTADITDTDLYTVETNNGGTAKGSYDVVLKLKDADNYKWASDITGESTTVKLTFTITAAENSWTTTPSIEDWTYGQAANEPTYAAKFGTVKVVYTGTANDGTSWNDTEAPTLAGEYTATFTVDATDDYDSLSKEVTFTIAKAPVTVTADAAEKTYGDSDPDTFTWKVTDGKLVGNDALDIIINRVAGENAKTYAIEVSQEENANPNYDITFVNGTFTINKATLTVTAEDKIAIYGDAAPNYTVKITGWKYSDTEDVLGGELKFTCDYAQFSDKGTYNIKASGYESGNYEFSYVDGTLTVSAKPITVTIANKTSIYGNSIATLTADDNGGIVNGDTNVYKLTTTATSSSAVGKYDITGEALDGNYSVTFANEDDAYEITTRELTVTVKVANKKYDGLNTGTITSAILNNVANDDEVALVNGTATFTSVNAADGISIAFTDFTLSGEADVLNNYTLTQPTGVKANITNGWNPAVDTEYTVSASNSNGWLNADLVITAKDGYELSLTNTADGEWKETLIGAVEGADSSVTFYVRNTENGAISEQVIENYKLDKNTETTGTTGKVSFDEKNGWETFLHTISFELFYKDEVTVKVEANDALSGVESMEYYAFESTDGTALTLEQIQAITDWTEMPEDGVVVEVQDEKQFVYYIRITDKAGNVTYLSTNGAEYDTTAPTVTGIENDEIYYTTQVVTVTDKNLESITLNDEPVILDNATLTLKGNADAVYTIVAQDKAGNTTTVTVTMKEITTVKEQIKDITEKDVNSSDKETVQDVIDHVDELLKDEDLTEDEKKALEDIKTEAEKLIDKVEETDKADETEDINKVKDITPENVTTDDKEDLEKAKADLEKALEDYKGNYTDEEKRAIEDKIKGIDELLKVIENMETAANAPETSDFNNLWTLFALFFVSEMSIIGITTYERKRRF